jgi:signal peptide peptidase SppA
VNVVEKLTANLPVLSDHVDRSDVVAVVKLHGIITPNPSPLGRGAINMAAVESALTKAFDHDRLKAVALAINSPGGAPTQSALVAERIRGLAEEKNVPVLAFCEDVAASGGYWLACAGDEIIAHRTSMVGSIGVISASFGLNGLIERIGVERRVHTAGEHKHRLDPFQPESSEDVEWLGKMHGALHEQFVDWVRERRGDKLKAGTELFDGEVWLGNQAKELGLVDELGSMRAVLEKRYPDAKIVVAEPRKGLLSKLGVGGPSAMVADGIAATIGAVEHRLSWSRFGL